MRVYLNILKNYRQKIPSVLRNIGGHTFLRRPVPEKTYIFGDFCLNALINGDCILKIYGHNYLIFKQK